MELKFKVLDLDTGKSLFKIEKIGSIYDEK